VADVWHLGQALRTNATLKELYLEENKITNADTIGEALDEANSTLCELEYVSFILFMFYSFSPRLLLLSIDLYMNIHNISCVSSAIDINTTPPPPPLPLVIFPTQPLCKQDC
jgi:hypothetical protein